MIMPTKHIRFSESLLGLSGIILNILSEPMTVDEIWYKYSEINNSKNKFPAYHNFDNLVLATNCLFLIGAIEIDSKGKLQHAVN
ncbi:MAG: ABC-three component system middle component 6 [Flavobacterium sp.]|jgi:hypothetical protein